jgi:hypothetical protein
MWRTPLVLLCLFGPRGFCSQVGVNQFIGQNELGIGNITKGQGKFSLVICQADGAIRYTQQVAPKLTLPLNVGLQYDPRLKAGEPFKILRPNKWPVNPG